MVGMNRNETKRYGQVERERFGNCFSFGHETVIRLFLVIVDLWAMDACVFGLWLLNRFTYANLSYPHFTVSIYIFLCETQFE